MQRVLLASTHVPARHANHSFFYFNNNQILAGAIVSIAHMGICPKDLGGFVPRAGMCAMCLLAALMVSVSTVHICPYAWSCVWIRLDRGGSMCTVLCSIRKICEMVWKAS